MSILVCHAALQHRLEDLMGAFEDPAPNFTVSPIFLLVSSSILTYFMEGFSCSLKVRFWLVPNCPSSFLSCPLQKAVSGHLPNGSICLKLKAQP